MKHYFGLLNFKKAFQQAQDFHQYAIKNGSDETRKQHIQHHIDAIAKGESNVFVQRSGKPNNK